MWEKQFCRFYFVYSDNTFRKSFLFLSNSYTCILALFLCLPVPVPYDLNRAGGGGGRRKGQCVTSIVFKHIVHHATNVLKKTHNHISQL